MSGFAAKLLITDGTASGTVDLLSPASGFSLQSWIPAIPAIKGGGTWQDSPLANGRKPIHRRWANASETFELAVRNFQQDTVIRDTQILRRLLEKAAQYWTTEWQKELVWIEARGPCETNSRYAIIYDWRSPQDGNPYAEPFQNPSVMAGFESFPLILERCFWQDTQPGTGECVPISAVQSFCWPWYLEFNGTTSDVNCSNGAQIDDLHSGTFTAEAWILPRTFGEGNQGRVFDKDNYTGPGINVGWQFLVDSAFGLWASVAAATTNALSQATLSDLVPGWVHVAMTYNNGGNRLIRMWVNGVEVNYTTQQAAVGLIASDVGEDLYIGNVKTNARTFDGYVGWSRASSTIRYATATFTPPDRCTLPDIDASTAGQWIGVEASGATIDNQEGTAAYDGTQSNCLFGCACEFDYGNTDGSTCDDEVFITNKHNLANITDIYYYDAAPAGFSANLMFAALPYAFLPAVPAVGDIVYFGINTALADSGPFCSLVFDIGTAQNDLTIAWEYWSSVGPGWVALATIVDHTDTAEPFDTVGVNPAIWVQPSNWVTTTINGVTGYWIRARVTAIGGAPSPPTQQNRDIYSVVWPYVDIDEDEIGGDIAALVEEKLTSYTFAVQGIFHKYLTAVRSLSRGENFSAYINIADEQNDPGITVAFPNAPVGNNINAPSGRAALYTPAGSGTFVQAVRIDFSASLSEEYNGRYHAYLRTEQSGGVVGDMDVRAELEIYIIAVGSFTTFATEIKQVPAVGNCVIDLGEVVYPGTSVTGELQTSNASISIYIRNNDAGLAATLTLFDLILLPADECIIEATDIILQDDNTAVYSPLQMDIDSIKYPKKSIRTIVQNPPLSEWRMVYRPISAGPAMLQANANQRLWVFGQQRTFPFVDPDYWYGPIAATNAVQIEKAQRYFSMRGAR